jgi:hypothetical protein
MTMMASATRAIVRPFMSVVLLAAIDPFDRLMSRSSRWIVERMWRWHGGSVGFRARAKCAALALAQAAGDRKTIAG